MWVKFSSISPAHCTRGSTATSPNLLTFREIHGINLMVDVTYTFIVRYISSLKGAGKE